MCLETAPTKTCPKPAELVCHFQGGSTESESLSPCGILTSSQACVEWKAGNRNVWRLIVCLLGPPSLITSQFFFSFSTAHKTTLRN